MSSSIIRSQILIENDKTADILARIFGVMRVLYNSYVAEPIYKNSDELLRFVKEQLQFENENLEHITNGMVREIFDRAKYDVENNKAAFILKRQPQEFFIPELELLENKNVKFANITLKTEKDLYFDDENCIGYLASIGRIKNNKTKYMYDYFINVRHYD